MLSRILSRFKGKKEYLIYVSGKPSRQLLTKLKLNPNNLEDEIAKWIMNEVQKQNMVLIQKLQKGGKYIIIVDPETAQEIKIPNPFFKAESQSQGQHSSSQQINYEEVMKHLQAVMIKMFEYFEKGLDFGLDLGRRMTEKIMDKTIDNIVSYQQKASLARLIAQAIGAVLSQQTKKPNVEIREQGEKQ